MTSLRSTLAWLLALALIIAASAHATEAPPGATSPDAVPNVTISSSRPCDGRSPDEARRLALEAQRVGAHSRAAECFRAAGDPVRANRAQMRASADTGAASAQRFKDSVETARAQAKRIRAGFRKS